VVAVVPSKARVIPEKLLDERVPTRIFSSDTVPRSSVAINVDDGQPVASMTLKLVSLALMPALSVVARAVPE
jgi:hypothetical protein